MKKLLIISLFALFSLSCLTIHAQNGNSYLKNKITVDFTYKRYLSPFGEVWPNGFGGYAGYAFAFQQHYLITVKTGYIDNQISSALEDSSTYENASSVIIPIHIGGRYYFIDDKFMPFVTFINGLNIVFENTSLGGKKEKRTLVKYAWTVGFGLTYNMLDNISLDLAAKYNSHFYTTAAMMTSLEYTFGVGISL